MPSKNQQNFYLRIYFFYNFIFMKTPFLFVSALIVSAFFAACGGDTDNESPAKDSTVLLYSEFHNFESGNYPSLSSEKAFAGKNSVTVNPETEYGFGVFKNLSAIPSYGSLNQIHVTLYSWMDKSYPDATFVMSIDDTVNHKNIIWDGRSLDTKKSGTWGYSDFIFFVKKEWLQPQYYIRLYVWNKGKNVFFNDNVKLEFYQVIPK